MVTAEPGSAIIVRIPIPIGLQRLRARWDWAASVSVPAHVTILFPFLPLGHLGSRVRRELAAIAAVHQPFDVRFARVGRFPGVVYVAPEPSESFTRLTAAVVGQYPDFPPYGGAFEKVIPHLTVCESSTAPLDEIAADAARVLPFAHRVSKLDVLVEDTDGHWRSRWHLALGVKP